MIDDIGWVLLLMFLCIVSVAVPIALMLGLWWFFMEVL